MKTRVLAGALWRDKDGWLFLETMIGDRHRLIEPQTIMFANTSEKVRTDELQEWHYGQDVIATCEIQ